MLLNQKIADARKSRNLTQEALANQLGVSNQAVSKWESGQSCPDVELLPRLADLFGISLDELFGREPSLTAYALPWEEDGKLRAVLFVGQKLVAGHPVEKQLEFHYEGPALHVESAFSVYCGDVQGHVEAKGNVACGDVAGGAKANGHIDCGDVIGGVNSGGSVSCGDVKGTLNVGGDASCGDVAGNVCVGGNLACGDIGGRIVTI